MIAIITGLSSYFIRLFKYKRTEKATLELSELLLSLDESSGHDQDIVVVYLGVYGCTKQFSQTFEEPDRALRHAEYRSGCCVDSFGLDNLMVLLAFIYNLNQLLLENSYLLNLAHQHTF